MKKNYYFLGICGISMSTLAIMLAKEGNYVSGNDKNSGETARILKEFGIHIDKKTNKKAIKNADYVVCSSAIKDDNKQKIFAKKCKKKILTRGQVLGMISKKYKNVIAVAGSHGKTTTTAMIYEILKVANKNPTLHLGGLRIEDNKNFEFGCKSFFVTEACEYCDNFLHLHPTISVITNIEKEHMDYFKTFDNQVRSFEKFKNQSKIVVDSCQGYNAKKISHKPNGDLCFELWNETEKLMDLNMRICEDVNTQNCIYAYQVAKLLKIDDETIKKGLENFAGVKTRFEKVKCKYFENVVCDYAHHPTEISKTIDTAKTVFKNKKIVTIFQPHTYSRTKILFDEFVEVFSDIETTIFYKTYSAREKRKEGFGANKLALRLKKNGKDSYYFSSISSLIRFLRKFDNDTVLIFIGAGDLPSILNKCNFLS